MKQTVLILYIIWLIQNSIINQLVQFNLNQNIPESYYRNYIIKQNQNFIQKNNKDNKNTFLLENNQFIQFTIQQFKAKYANLHLLPTISNYQIDNLNELTNNLKITGNQASYILGQNTYPSVSNNSNKVIPGYISNGNSIIINVDWAYNNKVTPVRYQGQCNSCYAFTTLASIQSSFLIKNNTNVYLSNQQIIDCDTNADGCNGGWITSVLNYASYYGLTDNSNYPYTGVKGKCKILKGPYKIHSWRGGYINNCATLTTLVSQRPVITPIFAGNRYFMYYKSGILNQCGSLASLDHAVLLVGVYHDKYYNYWRVKNSWGINWGESGYMRLSRSVNNICQICSYGFLTYI